MRALLILIILALQALFGWLLYQDNSSCCLPDTAPAEVLKKSLPLSFLWSDPKPETAEGWLGIKDSLINSLGEHQQLEITAFYCNEEKSGSDSDTLAKQRAMQTRALFPELKDEQVVYATRQVDCSTFHKTERFEAVSFAIRTENIVETEDETLIYFPFNSTEKLNNNEVEEYLNKVIARVLKSNETISLTGHTDNIGDEPSNLKLGQKRADIIKEYLLTGGVPQSQITSNSEGEINPVADNSSEEGRAKNRRTSLKIIPSS
jgi:OOP family OmpA-OmpF porin